MRKTKMKRITPKAKLIFIVLFLTCISLNANETIAVHPLRGSPQESEQISRMAHIFFDAIIHTLPEVPGGYLSYPIDLSLLSPDVPEGGFPPWVCPSPSITRNAVYAITGEMAPDPGIPGGFRLRLYLWQLDGTRLLGSDEMTIEGPEDLSILPFFLEWVLSWIVDEADIECPSGIGDQEMERYWLYLGLRGGGGYSQWTHDFKDDSTDHIITSFTSINAALQASVQLTRFFELQTEFNFIADFGPVEDHIAGEEDSSLFSLELKIPILAKLVLQSGRLRTGLFAGAYLHLPLMHSGSDATLSYYDYRANIPGFVFGMNVGWHLGRGHLFFDGRFEYDGHWFTNEPESINYRHSARFNIGYELGFFPKNR